MIYLSTPPGRQQGLELVCEEEVCAGAIAPVSQIPGRDPHGRVAHERAQAIGRKGPGTQ
jgi:hypothetical protein